MGEDGGSTYSTNDEVRADSPAEFLRSRDRSGSSRAAGEGAGARSHRGNDCRDGGISRRRRSSRALRPRNYRAHASHFWTTRSRLRVFHIRNVRVSEPGSRAGRQAGLRAHQSAGAAGGNRTHATAPARGAPPGEPDVGSRKTDAGDGNHAGAKRRGCDTRGPGGSGTGWSAPAANRGNTEGRDPSLRRLALAIHYSRQSVCERPGSSFVSFKPSAPVFTKFLQVRNHLSWRSP